MGCGRQAFKPLSLTDGPYRIDVDSSTGATGAHVYDEAHREGFEERLAATAFPQRHVALDSLQERDAGLIRRRDIYRLNWPLEVGAFDLFAFVSCVYPAGEDKCMPGAVTLYLLTWTESTRRYSGVTPA